MKHTKGPWEYYNPTATTPDRLWIEHPESGESIADVLRLGVGDKQAEANANLIAAAPEMLEALELSLRHINELLEDNPRLRTNREIGLCIKLRKLIAKAKGLNT